MTLEEVGQMIAVPIYPWRYLNYQENWFELDAYRGSHISLKVSKLERMRGDTAFFTRSHISLKVSKRRAGETGTPDGRSSHISLKVSKQLGGDSMKTQASTVPIYPWRYLNEVHERRARHIWRSHISLKVSKPQRTPVFQSVQPSGSHISLKVSKLFFGGDADSGDDSSHIPLKVSKFVLWLIWKRTRRRFSYILEGI